MKWSTNPPETGDMVRVRVSFYYHYGIFIDDGRVVQFGLPDNTGTPPEQICVRVTDVYEFIHGGMLETAALTRGESARRRRPEATARLALSRVGETGYDVLHNNCEHFALSCLFEDRPASALDGIRAAVRRKLGRS